MINNIPQQLQHTCFNRLKVSGWYRSGTSVQGFCPWIKSMKGILEESGKFHAAWKHGMYPENAEVGLGRD